MSFEDGSWAIRCVWLRYFSVFKKSIAYGLVTTIVEPIFFILAFGVGMGTLIGDLEIAGHTLTYRQFILGGIIGQTLLLQSFFEASYGGFVRMYYQKIYHAMSTTPVTLSEVLWGELLWDSSKATFSASIVLLIGVTLGDFSWYGALICLPVLFIGGLLFAALGLYAAALARNIDQISYPQQLLVFPMFLFCGVYFPLELFPGWLSTAVWILPLAPLISLVRTLVLDLPLQIYALPLLLFWFILLIWASRRAMTRRLIK
jgi:lipooligosaccharide transport system permease protein